MVTFMIVKYTRSFGIRKQFIQFLGCHFSASILLKFQDLFQANILICSITGQSNTRR